MNKWLALPNETKRNIYIGIAEKTGMSAFAVEKDWWVVQTLGIIFEMEIAEHLVFKGGTSLSKAWKLIQRFSEDVDLAIDREFFGYKGELGKSQRDKLRKTASAYVAGDFFVKLQKKFEEKGIFGLTFEVVEEKESDKDRTINIYFPHVIELPGYLQPRVQIEISCRSLREPFSIQKFASLVDEEYTDRDFAQTSINIPTVKPERTFLEKLFLLQEEFQRPNEKMRVDRLSRHLYDLYHLSKTEYVEIALIDNKLYKIIVEHRYKFTRIGGVDYNLHQPQTIDPIPIQEVIGAWEVDYKSMLEQMIYEENPPSFDEIIKELTNLKHRINALPWKFDKEFPLPNQK